MIAKNETHYGSLFGIKHSLAPDVLRAAPRISGKDLDEITRSLPQEGDEITEFRDSSLAKSLTFDSGGLLELKDRIGKDLNRCDFPDLQHTLAKLFEHSQILILPNPGDSQTASPALIVNESYYEDPETKNHKLVELASLLANKYEITNFYLPDVRTKYLSGTKTLSLYGGHKIMKFLDHGASEQATKEYISEHFESPNPTSFELRKMLDFGAAQLDSNGSTAVTVKYPRYMYIEAMGMRFDDEQNYHDYITGIADYYRGPNDEKIIRRAASTFSSNVKPRAQNAQEAIASNVKELIALSLKFDTPAHIANLILAQDWLWDKDHKEVVLLPSADYGEPFDYSIDDILNFSQYFTKGSSIEAVMKNDSDRHDQLVQEAENRALSKSNAFSLDDSDEAATIPFTPKN